MKFYVYFIIALCIFVHVAFTADHESEGSPVSITKNNIGNIVKVDVDASAVVSSNVELNVIRALLAALNQQAAIVADTN